MFGQQAAVGNSKPVCNYYLKGNCKYGARCWNFHPPNQGGTTMPNTFLGGGSSHVFGGKNTAQQDPKKEFQDFVKQVSGEMTQWERSGQWLVSSFSPIKGHPPFSGFNDTSPEEFRIKAYEALKTNTSGAYQAHWSEMQQRFKQLREAVKMSTQEAIQAMREVFFTKSTTEAQPEQQQTLKQPSLFGKPTGQNVFGGTSQSSGGGAGLLGAKPQPSVFGATPSVFGGNQAASSVFGGSTSKPVFGTQGMMGAQNMGSFPVQSSNIFGGGGSGSNAFKSGSQNTQASTLFGGTQNQTTTSSMFGASPSVAPVQGQTTSNMFGEQNKGAGSNIFSSGSQNQASVFGRSETPAAPNTIGGQGNIFGNQSQSQQQSGLFGNQPAQPQQQTGSVFGPASVFGSNPTPTTPAQAAPQPSIFGGASDASAATVFGSTTGKKSGNIFGGSGGGFVGNTQPGSRLFSNSATSNVFANAAASASANTSTGLFGKPADSTQPSVSQGTPNFFGELIQGNQSYSVSVSVAREHPEWYTPLDQLKPEEKAEFEADRFTLIPLRPPPVELCA